MELGAVLVHPHGKQLTGGGRGISNGVSSGLDGAEDVLLCGAPGGNDGDVWEIFSNLDHDLRGACGP